jgi:thioredoxin reductase (NADPH)
MTAAGVQCDPETLAPAMDAETFETNVPNLFLAGGCVAGKATVNIFIENGRFHGEKIVSLLGRRLAD